MSRRPASPTSTRANNLLAEPRAVAGPSAGDGAKRNWATHAEVLAAAEIDAKHRGVRYYRNRGEHMALLYSVLRSRLAEGNNGTISVPQIVKDLYPGVDSLEEAEQKASSAKRWIRAMERLKLITTEPLATPNGKWLGLRFALLPVPQEVVRLAQSRGCSSVG